ncbi:S9 family peptidase [Roseibacillus ishigakijimensis]|uniref:Prolyl oligopeptidase family serine peptidase n=2 Tax=Roseibacillus ishigakijimensis TaxID=454146 RepID=A0A934RSZ6_9BACT|nr:prolyl oligopeptidase family serine peptidase [Roseibacillus ishigakijimensis]
MVTVVWALMAAAACGHGGTAAFEERNAAYREAIGTAPDERLSIRWSREGDTWYCLLGEGGAVRAVSTVDGSSHEGMIGELVEEVRERGPRRRRSEGGREREGREGDARLRFPREGELQLEGETHSAGEGWIWEQEPRWSPGKEFVAVQKVRDVAEREVHYVRSSPDDQLQPEHFTISYPKPGDELRVRLPVVFTAEGVRVPVDEKLLENPFQIRRLHWRDDHRLWFEYIERGFGKFRLMELDARSGVTRAVAAEEDERFVHVYEKCGWWDLGEGQLLWRSEADGWSHLYRVAEESGEKRQLTRGKWVVRGVEKVSEEGVLFRLSGYYEGQDPYYEHFARLQPETGEMILLTEGDGTHDLTWSPDEAYYVDRFSRVDQPPVHELRRGKDGALIAVLAESSSAEMEERGFALPERFVTTDREGRYEIHGVIWKPRDFDPAKSYPVVESIYAGPHGAFVPKAWRSWYGHRSEMAEAGFVVVQIDGRGTNYRGREFQQFAYKNLKDAGFPDRIKWLRAAAQDRPWMDLGRVGLYGGSAGGQSTLAALLWHGDFYQAGVADCGCHDNRMDKIWWNEQWMDWPVDESYAANSNTEHVDRLQGALLLTVGEVDTNVDPSSTLQVVDALIRADKDFDFLSVPNGNHGIGESPYLRRKRVEFFQRHLGGPSER